jgi:Zn-finger protein
MYHQKSAKKYREKNKELLNAKQRQTYLNKKKSGNYLNILFKLCASCNKQLSKSMFKTSYSSKDGLTYTCKNCILINNNTKTNQLRRMLRSAKERSLEKNMSFDLDLEFLESLSNINICPAFKTKLEWEYIPERHSTHKNKDNRPSLDRIDSSKAYTKDNVKIISWRANKLKNESSIEELKMLLEYTLNNSSYTL